MPLYSLEITIHKRCFSIFILKLLPQTSNLKVSGFSKLDFGENYLCNSLGHHFQTEQNPKYQKEERKQHPRVISQRGKFQKKRPSCYFLKIALVAQLRKKVWLGNFFEGIEKKNFSATCQSQKREKRVKSRRNVLFFATSIRASSIMLPSNGKIKRPWIRTKSSTIYRNRFAICCGFLAEEDVITDGRIHSAKPKKGKLSWNGSQWVRRAHKQLKSRIHKNILI